MVPYERFDAWKIAHQLALEVYAITERWPANERFGLTAQVRRAALSAPTNIAEGSAKRGSRELRRYLDIALGSLRFHTCCDSAETAAFSNRKDF
jgi:four helix bundle protein